MVMLKPAEPSQAPGANLQARSHRSQEILRAHSQEILRAHSQEILRARSQEILRARSQDLPRPRSQRLPRADGAPWALGTEQPPPHSHRLPVLVGAAPASQARPDERPAPSRYDAVVAQIQVQPRSRASRIAKRALDVVGSVLGLLVLAPVLAGIALAIKLTSRGPVLFIQQRSGLGGGRFRVLKFRTMVVDAEHRMHALAHLNEVAGPAFKIRRDPRITSLGAVLRRLSLDELPQLWNVARGDMSLVGPRPPTPGEVERYTARQVQRLSVVPGITGLWQVSGRSEITDFERWVDLDLEYARSWSMWTDLRILLKTVVVVVRARGAH